MRFGFTIVFNGLHHLQSIVDAERLYDFCFYMRRAFDFWVIIEGAADNTGSTNWCKPIPEEYHNNGSSIDGTYNFLDNYCHGYESPIVHHVYGMVFNKDQMVNKAIELIKLNCNIYLKSKTLQPIYLWQVDCDEQWKLEDMYAAEKELKGDTGMFLSNFYVGKNIIVKGEWGEGKAKPYRRLWKWKGQAFKSHEPPVLEGGNGKEQLLSQKFNHYSYLYEKDVEFKDKFYGGHEGIYNRWKEMQKETKFPQPLSRLMPARTGEICISKR